MSYKIILYSKNNKCSYLNKYRESDAVNGIKGILFLIFKIHISCKSYNTMVPILLSFPLTRLASVGYEAIVDPASQHHISEIIYRNQNIKLTLEQEPIMVY